MVTAQDGNNTIVYTSGELDATIAHPENDDYN
jgi:hypothetical protein